MDYRETEAQGMLRQMVRKFAENEVKPAALEYDHKVNPEDCYPWDLLKRASELGLRTISLPKEYGGGGVKDLISLLIVVEELGAGDNGFASSVRHDIGLGAWMDVLCNKEQKDEIFPQMVKDDTFLISDAITEPNSGTDSILMGGVPGLAMQTYAERRGDEYVINGSKHFVSNAGVAKLYLLHTRTDRKLPLNQCHSIFLLKSDTPGLSVGKFHNKLGRRTILSAEVYFDDMRVPARYLVREEGGAARYEGLAAFQTFLIPATILGTHRACYDAVVEYGRLRIQGGKPIIRHQLVASQVSEMRVRMEAARALLYKQAWCWQNQYEYDAKLTALIRAFVNEVSGHLAYQLQEIFGAPAVDREMAIEKLTRDVLTTVHGPSTYSGLIKGAPDWEPETKV